MKLALFFTKGVSLEIWKKVGNLDREIKPYQCLTRDFDKIFFLTYGEKDNLKYQNIFPEKIKILPNKQRIPSLIYSLLLPFLYWKELKEVDILKTNQVSGSWTAVIAKKIYKKKLIIRQGRQWSIFARKKKLNKWRIAMIDLIERFAYKNADAIMVSSKADKEYVEKRYNINPDKINYIPNYIDTDLFKPLDIEKENRICCVAKLEKQKNLENLIKAVEGLDIRLVIFGSGSLSDKLKGLSSQVELRDNIPNNHLPEEINKSKLFILPSNFEGCPKALLEAMSCGVPVIGADVYGINEIINQGKNGYLCGTSVESIRKAIKEVLSNETLQKKLSQNARKTILNDFSLEKILEKEIKIHKTL